ncbi:MAG TPA: UDP-N-acetylglucosamine 2-epimerase (non-hydrolyzing) [Armatimonadota bacterium]|nr:UDP-N-acetylglucosamine 2-epimerase (non-hydrolyzing) [Armatimonadota bacterium]
MLLVASIIGTRPDALKMAPVILELARHSTRVKQVVISTGQHREMLQQVLDVFHIVPDHNLDVMLPGQSLAQITARVLERLDPLLAELRPSVLLAQGDTTTTFVASLAAFYRQIPVGHVEAGLRTNNRYDPFPEEINRRLTATVADLHFAPTDQAASNLEREGVPSNRILQVGNTVIDALLEVAARPYQFADGDLDRLTSGPRRVVLVTAHRRENLGAPLRRICAAVQTLVRAFPDVQCVFQMHKNPEVRDVIRAQLAGEERVALVEPQDYVPWVNLMKRCTLILTDSGGIQEEAPALGKPILVMRETTERPEGVTAGTARLVGTDPEAIVAEASRLLTDSRAYEQMSRAVNPYGDGRAAARICEALFQHFAPA